MSAKQYLIIPDKNYITVNLIGNCDFSGSNAFQEEIKSHLSADSKPHIVLNCDRLETLSKDWIRALFLLQSTLKNDNKFIRFILVKPALKKEFAGMGIDTAFKVVPNLREALVDFGLVTKKMLDTNFINPFLTATLHVLKVQANVEAQTGKIYVKKTADANVGDISGIIGIVSDSFNGSVIISFPEATFLKVMSGMLGEEYTTVNQDILDGAGEITNMIFGQAKIVLNEKGYGIKTALPSVVTGKAHSLSSLSQGTVVVVPFESPAGNFFIEISLSA